MAGTDPEPQVDVPTAAHEKLPSNDVQQEAHYQLPDAKTLEEAGNLPIKDENGNEVLLKSLYENQTGRQLLVFIRHFYCGVRPP